MPLRNSTVDVLIVGAGPSGAVAAVRLAEAGFTVLVLEQGPRIDPGAFPGPTAEFELAALKQWHPDPNIRGGEHDYPINNGNAEIWPAMFAAVGGASVLYAAQWPRALPSDFRVRTLDGVADDWPITYWDLLPFYEANDIAFGVSGLGGDPAYPPGADPPMPPLPLRRIGAISARAFNRLGWHWWPASNAIASRPYQGRRPCVQRGTCQWGCAEGAKGSVDVTHWPKALALGVELRTECRVSQVVTDRKGLATGVHYFESDGTEHRATARVVILAANAIGTPRLLLLSRTAQFPDGLANSSGMVGRRLMMHPMSVVTAVMDEDLNSSRGAWGASVQSMQFYETDTDRGFLRGAKWQVQPSGGPLTLLAALVRSGWDSDPNEFVMSRLNRSFTVDFIGEDLPDEANRVELDAVLRDRVNVPAPRVTYRISAHSKRLMEFHTRKIVEFCREVGAINTDIEQTTRYGAFHLLGTARMGLDPERSVVNDQLRAHDVPNLYIVDGSVFVTSTGVNPTPTIAALALRTAEYLARSRRHQTIPLDT
jgi:choline dehydrogenase-like flavoprotein